MTNLLASMKEFATVLESVNTQLGQLIQSVVQQNVEDYLDTLNNLSPEEQTKMYNRTLLQADVTNNKKFRDRRNAYNQINQQIKQERDAPLLTLETLENPLKAALVDNSILQLFKIANEIALVIRDGKMDGPKLDQLVEKSVNIAIHESTLPEVRSMIDELVDRVQTVYFDDFFKKIDPEIDKYILTIVDSTLSGRTTT